jgi:gamma-glutamyltranspeptidase/glutathione hydrolase
MELHTAGHRRGIVCAPHHEAAEAGRSILAEGGNAIEAMVAMAAMIAVVYPHMNHVGGDGFWLIRFPNGGVRAIMAPGPAGANAQPELYREYETIPSRGPLAALTVPGAIAGWILALEAANATGGKLPLDVLLLPAIVQARNGYVVSRSQAQLTADKLAELAPVPGFAETFLVDGKPPAAGTTLVQEALAATLRHLALDGLDDFYRGDVGREIAADLERIGSPVTRADLTGYEAYPGEPLQVELPSGTVYNTDAPTQGVASLMILALFARLGVTEAEGFDHIHCLVEATKRALRTRDRVLTDPHHLAHRLERCLEPRFIAGEVMKIDRRKAARWPFASGEGDTIWMGAADTAAHRRLDAKSWRELFIAARRAQSSGAGTPADPHPQSGAGGPQGRPHHGLWRHGRRRPAADPSGGLHPPRDVRRTAGCRDRSSALGVWQNLGRGAHALAP